MVFSLTILDKEAQYREFMLMLNSLEVGCDFISSLVRKGETLLEVNLIEKNKLTPLPLELFDGFPFTAPIQQLEQEWVALLSQPASPLPAVDQEMINLTHQRMRLCESSMSNQQLMISYFKSLLRRVEEGIFHEPTRSVMINHYQRQIDTYTRQSIKAQTRQQQLLKRLNELAA